MFASSLFRPLLDDPFFYSPVFPRFGYWDHPEEMEQDRVMDRRSRRSGRSPANASTNKQLQSGNESDQKYVEPSDSTTNNTKQLEAPNNSTNMVGSVQNRGIHTLPALVSSMFAPFDRALTTLDKNMSTMEMRVDLSSTPTSYSVHASIPGVDKKDINITVDGKMLTIDAERRYHSHIKRPRSQEGTSEQTQKEMAAEKKSDAMEVSTEDEDVSYHHVESYYGRVSRCVTLPDDAKMDDLTAKYDNGVLSIDVPRSKVSPKGKKVLIQ